MVVVPDLMQAHVSVENEFPEDLFNAMAAFIQKHPVYHWATEPELSISRSIGSSIPVSARLQGTSSSTALPQWLIPTATARKLQDLAYVI